MDPTTHPQSDKLKQTLTSRRNLTEHVPTTKPYIILTVTLALVGYLIWANFTGHWPFFGPGPFNKLATWTTARINSAHPDTSVSPAIIASPSPPPPTPIAQPKSMDLDFPHELLPDFNITIHPDWQLTIKQFGQVDTIGFYTPHSPNPNSQIGINTMGAKIAQGDVSLQFMFFTALDDLAYHCSNTVPYQEIGADWVRFFDSTGLYYVKGVRFNYQPKEYESVAYQPEDPWENDSNQVYRTCYAGNFLWLKTRVVDADGQRTMSFPRIVGNPTATQRTQIDSMVRSMQGVLSSEEFRQHLVLEYADK